MTSIRLLRFLLAATLLGGSARAAQITFTITTMANGTLGTTPFSNALVTITSLADTNNVVVNGSFFDLIAISSTVSIAGIAGSPAKFTDTTFWEDVNGAGDIAFGDSSGGAGFACIVSTGCPILGLVNPLTSAGIVSYMLNSSIGPVSGPDFPVNAFDAFENIPTTGGLLSIPEATNTAEVGDMTEGLTDTFTAVATPEAASVVLLGPSLAFLLLIRFRIK
jgi:hypothetical protein